MTVVKRVTLLLFGYARKNFKSNQIVPTSIIQLLSYFYDGNVEWKIEKIYTRIGRKMNYYGPKLIIHGISLQFTMLPVNHYIALQLDIDSLPPNIVNFVLSISINCVHIPQKQLSFNGGWTKKCNHIIKLYGYSWHCFKNINKYTLIPLDVNDDSNYFNLSFDINLWHIKYYKMNVINHIKWNNNIKHKNGFKNDIFDIFWEHDINESIVYIAVKPAGLPHAIYCVEMLFEFKSELNMTLRKYKGKYCRTTTGNTGTIQFECDYSKFIKTTLLTILIVNVMDTSHRIIPMDQWRQFGFDNSTVWF